MHTSIVPDPAVDRRILVAGATGAIGRRLVPLLLHQGYVVTGLTRRADRADGLRAAGAHAVVVDALDRAALIAAVVEARPAVVIHQLTDLSTPLGVPMGEAEYERTARLRDVGTAHLVAATEAAGARRLIAQSVAGLYAPGATPHREDDPLMPTDGEWGVNVLGVRALEARVLAGASFDGIVLRYGWLYGPGTGLSTPWSTPGLHVDAAAWAASLAIHRGRAGTCNVADDDGSVSSRRAVGDLGWMAALRVPDGPADVHDRAERLAPTI